MGLFLLVAIVALQIPEFPMRVDSMEQAGLVLIAVFAPLILPYNCVAHNAPYDSNAINSGRHSYKTASFHVAYILCFV